MTGLQLYTTPESLPIRGILARYPNSNPELIPVTISGGAAWIAPADANCNSTYITQPFPQNYPGARAWAEIAM